MRPFLVFLVFFVMAARPVLACDNHSHTSRICTWHTKALKPYLPQIATGTVNPDSAFDHFSEAFSRYGAHLEEAYATLGLKEIKHYDVLDLYKKSTGKKFIQNPAVKKCVEDLKALRGQHPYMSSCADALQTMRINLYGSVKDTLLLQAMSAAIDVYEEDGSFWDVMMHDFELSPKNANAIRRDTWDLENFSTYYMALRGLGLDHQFAHTIASLEMAYAAVQCKNCGVW
jgi:hypothetical protein